MQTKKSRNTSFPIKYFIIKGLYGYKSLEFKTKGKTTIVVSENGSGKTTLLDTLHNVLKGNIPNLKKLDFSEIEIQLTVENTLKSFVIKKSELVNHEKKEEQIFGKYCFDDILLNEQYTEPEITDAILAYGKKNITAYQFDIIQSIKKSTTFPEEFFFSYLKNNILHHFKNDTPSIKNLTAIEKAFKHLDCIYLPTYRKVEKVFVQEKKNPNYLLINDQNLNADKGKNNYDKITYGLNDVEEYLADLGSSIERKSNLGYRELSANILEDLLKNKKLDTNKKIPKQEDLIRFLSRVQGVSRENIIKELDSFYNNQNDTDTAHKQYLHYFLSRLNKVIDETKELELKIEIFVNKCNEYLNSSGDSKEILFDTTSLKVKVYDCFTKKQILLNDLSSGEKQVVSLMSFLYLRENNNKIILIDEPELSLSLNWQRRILPDMDKANNVAQIIAITHSPFIFDNELDPNATPLKIKKNKLMEKNYD